tara:strand:+ start:5302 stop:6660 length:1359 start_codon:yes stop_codon:yes gene_type:complete
MNRVKPNKNTVYFLCSPSLGILDNWLPVLWKLKEKKNNLKFIIIFPKPNFVDKINLSNILLILSEKIFDSVVFKSDGGDWLVADNFSNIKSIYNLTTFEKFLLKIIRRLKKWPITRILGKIFQFGYSSIRRNLNKRYLYDWQFAKNHAICILYDVYEESKPYNVELIRKLNDVPRFSIQHGINIVDGGVTGITKKVPNSGFRKDVKAYLFSSKERPLYEQKYAIHKSSMDVVGIPRHNSDWMEFIRLRMLEQSDEINSLKKNTIFIISRPGNTNYHSYKRKKKALEDIKRLAWNDLNKNIVIKLHPKEEKEGIYEEVFGADTYGDKWLYSDIHPFILGKKCAFAISFFSGVVIDMVALGVPTIEYLDLRGIPECDNEDSLRDKMGHPVFSFRYLGLVLGASDYKQMKVHAMNIMNDREKVISKLKAKYNELFPQIKNINEKIARDILRGILK